MSLATLRSVLISDPLIILATVFMGTFSLLASFFDSEGHLQHKLARTWSRILLWVSGVTVRVEGLEKIDSGGSYVFVANHCSYMDTPVVLAHIPVEFRFLAKQGLFSIPLLGTHLHRAGHIPVVRGNPRASVHSMTDAARIVRQRHISILVFPEGGRTQDGTLRSFKEGAAYIAIKAGVPAVPIALIGTRKVLPMGSGTIHGGVVEVRISDPIPTAEMHLKNRGELNQLLRDRIGSLLESGHFFHEHAAKTSDSR
jgi:1-acyl-sn-glycerol-3-phosphate acyltransferase